MTCATAPVALLEGAVRWTSRALANAEGVPLSTPTPCAEWDLGSLLAHMTDGLDAFTEASAGFVSLQPSPPRDLGRFDLLRDKACTLLTAWTHAAAADVWVHDQALHADLLLHVAAVEITVHGWDVARAVDAPETLPDDLAHALLPAAHLLLASADRPGRFAPPLEATYDAGPGERLLAQLGRREGWAR